MSSEWDGEIQSELIVGTPGGPSVVISPNVPPELVTFYLAGGFMSSISEFSILMYPDGVSYFYTIVGKSGSGSTNMMADGWVHPGITHPVNERTNTQWGGGETDVMVLTMFGDTGITPARTKQVEFGAPVLDVVNAPIDVFTFLNTLVQVGVPAVTPSASDRGNFICNVNAIIGQHLTQLGAPTDAWFYNTQTIIGKDGPGVDIGTLQINVPTDISAAITIDPTSSGLLVRTDADFESTVELNFVTTIGPVGVLNTDVGGDIQYAGHSNPRGVLATVSATANSAAVTAETAVLTLPAANYQNGRAFRLTYGWGIQGSAVGVSGAFGMHESTAGGTLLGDFSEEPPVAVAVNNYASSHSGVFVNTSGGNKNVAIVLTLRQIHGTGTVLHPASTARPRWCMTEDIGPASDWSNMPSLT